MSLVMQGDEQAESGGGRATEDRGFLHLIGLVVEQRVRAQLARQTVANGRGVAPPGGPGGRDPPRHGSAP